jgi:hypothetical protein
MRVCFTSYRPFGDGPVHQPFLESDPANMAYVLAGTYFSFYTLRKLSDRELREKLQPYDLVLVALDVEAIELVQRIVAARRGRVATYSEGHVADYQRLSPAGQISFIRIINESQINFLYWEKYLAFYRTLTTAPVEYLPYPYLLDQARAYRLPLEQRAGRAALPTGLAGLTRNGLANLAVAKKLLEAKAIEGLDCWLEGGTFEQDARAINYFLFSEREPAPHRLPTFNWRRWLAATHLDYRVLLKIKARWWPTTSPPQTAAELKIKNVSFYRRESWPKYLKQLAAAQLLIDLNNRETVGRNALDCAALEIPCVSTDRSDLQARLYPQTTLDDSWDIAAAVELCQRLLRDKNFYQAVVAHAAEAVRNFDSRAFLQRFQAIRDRYPHLLGQGNSILT